MDKSINNLTLFLFDVKTTEVSFECTRRSHPPKNRRVFLAAGPRSKSQPRASYQRPENEKKNRLLKTLFTWEPQSFTVQSDSFAGLTDHVPMRPDTHSEEKSPHLWGPGTPGSSALRNPLPKSPCVEEGCRAGLGQTLPAGSPIVWSRTSPVLGADAVNSNIRLGRSAACCDR